ncbi:MAG: hypothetical protein ACEQSF_02535 [Solirubrobacteraceae bacterium]
MKVFLNFSSFVLSLSVLIATTLSIFNIMNFDNKILLGTSIFLLIISYLSYRPIEPITQDLENLRIYGIISFVLNSICITIFSLIWLNNFLL